jgi:lysophospholipase L1-like esterase
MKAMRIAAMAMVVLAAGACTTTAPGAGGGRVEPTCPAITNWAVGDSITAGYGGVIGWPDQNPPVTPGMFANKGVGGQTIAWLSRQTGFDFAVCDEYSVAKPSKVVFQAGSNDLANAHLTLAAMQQDLQEMVAIFDSNGVDYRLVSITPIPSTADWTSFNSQRVAYNNWLAATYPSKFVNCDDNLRSGTWLNPAYAFGDRVHLSDAGQEVLANCILNEG